nr:ATP-binding protein [Oscillochloris trichoides]
MAIMNDHGRIDAVALSPLREQQMTALLALTRSTTEAPDMQTALIRALELIAATGRWSYGEVWQPHSEGGTLYRVASWPREAHTLLAFATLRAVLRITPGEGLLGWAWQNQHNLWLPDLAAVEQDVTTFQQVGLSSALLLPIRLHEQPIALLVLFGREVQPLDAALLHLIGMATAQVGAALKRLQQQAAIAERERLLHLMLDAAPDAMLIADGDEHVLVWNAAAERMFGYPAAEALGLPITRLIAARDAHTYFSLIADQRQGPTLDATIEVHARRRDGSEFPSEFGLAAWRSLQGEYFTCVVRDVTERQQNQAALRTIEASTELERVAQLKNEFLANMSHELRTPLNTILSLTEAVSEGVYGLLNDRQQQVLDVVTESGQHLLGIVNDILDMIKIEAGKIELLIEPVEIESICAASMRMVRQIAYAKRIQIASQIDHQVDLIEADPRRLKQILVNLLSNAVKFTPEGGRVTLVVRGDAEAQLVYLSVEDTGIGIAHTDLPRLFRPFVQLDARLSRRHEGTGLGLALVAHLTELHNGGVRIQSTPGTGSCFTIMLPWNLPALSSIQPLFGLDRPDRPTLLLADDHEVILHTMMHYLMAYGYRVHVARNGLEALDMARKLRPHCILMDLHMPMMDGCEAIRKIRAERSINMTPIIAMTALTIEGDLERCVESGANGYVSKPVTYHRLVAQIEALRH